jgi:hypothetical protein
MDARITYMNRGQVARLLHSDTILLWHVFVRRYDASCQELAHHGMKSHHQDLSILLSLGPLERIVRRVECPGVLKSIIWRRCGLEVDVLLRFDAVLVVV